MINKISSAFLKFYKIKSNKSGWSSKSNIRQMLTNLNPGKNTEILLDQYYIGKIAKLIKVFFILSIFICICLLYGHSNQLVNDEGQILRNGYGGSSYQVDLTANIEEKDYQVVIDVLEQVYTEDEINALYEDFEKILDETYLGDNEKPDYINSDLRLISSLKGYPFRIRWESSNYELLHEDGVLGEREAEEYGEEMYITAVISYEEFEERKRYDIVIYPRDKTPEEKIVNDIKNTIDSVQRQTQSEAYLQLPETIEDKEINWKETQTPVVLILISISLITLVGVWMGADNDLAKESKRREQQLKLEYSEFVSKLELLISSGMTLRGAMEKIESDYSLALKEGGEKKYVYEELHICLKKLRDGISENECYEMFGRRCGQIVYKKLVTLLVQNLKKGTKGLVGSLQNEASIAFDMRKQMARRMGEEAQTKLLFPMILMLCVVMIIIIIPAYFTFGF